MSYFSWQLDKWFVQMLFFLVWFEYSSKYDWFLWIWVDYRFGVQWGSAGHAAYIPYALPDPCLHDAAVVCQVARAPFVKSPDLHTVETGRDECHCIERERNKTMSNNKSTVLYNASHTVCSIPSNAGPVETDLLRPLVRFWSLPIPCNKSRNENKKELTDNVGVIYIFVCRGIGYGQANMKRFNRLKTKALIV